MGYKFCISWNIIIIIIVVTFVIIIIIIIIMRQESNFELLRLSICLSPACISIYLSIYLSLLLPPGLQGIRETLRFTSVS
jgi:hypothetical protein